MQGMPTTGATSHELGVITNRLILVEDQVGCCNNTLSGLQRESVRLGEALGKVEGACNMSVLAQKKLFDDVKSYIEPWSMLWQDVGEI